MGKIAIVDLKGPTAIAVAALVAEKPTGHGWYDIFPRNMWAVTFNGNPSRSAIKAASNCNLYFIRKMNGLKDPITAIASPDIKEHEHEKATKTFYKFAKEYKSLSQKVASVISGHINSDRIVVRKVYAGYDKNKLKAGYKGEFVIQEHDADKAGKHWDIRLEFPVTSLKKSLGKYRASRPNTNEPIEKNYPDKPGTVLRSFVNKKQEIPTSKNKTFLIKTEDHPKAYGTFEGEIKEGYGKGKVSIWDKGTYDLLDVEGNSKYTINFNGKKLKGLYALIRYQEGYLWIKINKKEAFVSSPPIYGLHETIRRLSKILERHDD